MTCDTSDSSTGNCVEDSSGHTVYQTYRSFLNFPVPNDSTFTGATFADAQLQLSEQYSWGCNPPSPAYVSLWDTGTGGQNHPTSSSTTWANQPAVGSWLGWDSNDYGYNSSCPPHDIQLPVTATAQAAATNSWAHLTLRLSADSDQESNLNQWSWKRFAASDLSLSYYWRNAPDTPTAYGTQNTFDAATGKTVTHCSTSASSPDWVNSTTTTWTATIDDQDRTSPNGSPSAANIDGEFPWQNLTNGNVGTVSDTGNPKAPNSVFTGTRSGSNRNEYEWQAYGAALQDDPWNAGARSLLGQATSQPCYFQIDQNPPTHVVQVSSTNYTSGELVGTQNTFTLTDDDFDTAAGGGSGTAYDVVGFYYGIDNSQPSQYVPVTAGTSPPSATITLTPFTTAEIDLYVQPVDRAGWKGPLQAFCPGTPTVASSYCPIDAVSALGNIDTLGWWRLNNHGTDSAVATATTGKDLSLSGGASWGCPTGAGASPAGYTCSLALDGTAGHATAQPVLGDDGSFSVSAWVNPSGCAQVYCAALSQDATSTASSSNVSGLTLGYQSSGTAWAFVTSATCQAGCWVSTDCSNGCWVFSMPQSNTAGDEYAPGTKGQGWYLAAAPVQQGEGPGSWTQLTGVFNSSHDELLLYVNGGDGAQHPGLTGTAAVGDGNPAASGPASKWPSAGVGQAIGSFRVGADWTGTTLAHFFSGSVSDACAFYGVLNPSDVTNLYDSASGDGCQALYTQYP